MTGAPWVSLLPSHGSFSQLTGWADCQQRYVIEKAFKPASTPAWWFIGGTAFHEATQAYDEALLLASRPPIGWLTRTFNELLDAGIRRAEEAEPDRTLWLRGGRVSREFPDREVEAFYRARAQEWCNAYERHSITSGETIFVTDEGVLGVELGFLHYFGGVAVKGSVDRVYLTRGGELGVRDIKTGASPGNPMQLGMYGVAVAAITGITPAFGDFWNPRKNGAGPPIPLARYDQAMFDRLFEAFDAQRKSGTVVPHLSPGCERCSVAKFCSAYGGAEAIDIT